ncbi:MAG: hypothetical protein ABGX16_10985 [Pirellulales bacterium]
MNRPAHRQLRPHRTAPRGATPRGRLFGLRQYGFKLRGSRYQRDRRYFDDRTEVEAEVDSLTGSDGLTGSYRATQTGSATQIGFLTKQEGRQLADLILKRIQIRLAGRIRNLAIHITNHSVELTGECRTYYTKQMAQHVAMSVLDYQQLVNNIMVC